MSLPNLIELQADDTIQTAIATVPSTDVIILVLGRFDATLIPQIRSICARAIVPAALNANALIVDNGDTTGLAGLMGQAVSESDHPPALLGILEPGTEPDLNHTALLRLPIEWGDYVRNSVLLTAELARGSGTPEKPVAVVLFGGDQTDKRTILRCVRRGWPVLICQGAGGLGDLILNNAAINDSDLSEILDTGTIYSLDLNGSVDDLILTLLGPIQGSGDVLLGAWARFDELDRAAISKQQRFRASHSAVLTLAVSGAFLAVIQSGAAFGNIFTPPRMWQSSGHHVLHVLLVLVPALLFILMGFSNRFREGNKWILLRGAAESIKQQIFRYRMKSGEYSEAQSVQASASSRLASAIKSITSSLILSEVSRTSIGGIQIYDKSRIDFLDPERYLRERVEDQIHYLVAKTARLDRQLRRLQIVLLSACGVGIIVASFGMDVWVGFATTVMIALAYKLQTDQAENSLVLYNIVLITLRNIVSWWEALSPWEMTRRINIDLLVDQTEKALELDTHRDLVQRLQADFVRLTERQKVPQEFSRAQVAGLASAIGTNLDQTIAKAFGPEKLDNYSGYLCVMAANSTSGASLPTTILAEGDYSLDAVPSTSLTLTVLLSRSRTESISEPVFIVDGNDAEKVTFQIKVNSSWMTFVPQNKELTFQPDAMLSPSAVFVSSDIEAADAPSTIRIQLLQKGATVQLLSLRINGVKKNLN